MIIKDLALLNETQKILELMKYQLDAIELKNKPDEFLSAIYAQAVELEREIVIQRYSIGRLVKRSRELRKNLNKERIWKL
jgi:hypothetical protein